MEQTQNQHPQQGKQPQRAAPGVVGLVDALLEGCAAISSDAKRIERCQEFGSDLTRPLLERAVRALADLQPLLEEHAAALDARRRGYVDALR